MLKISTVFQLLLAAFCTLLQISEHPPFWKRGCMKLFIFFCIHKDAFQDVLFSFVYTSMPKSTHLHPQKLHQQLLSGSVPNCYLNVLFPACAKQGPFVVENLTGTEEQDTTLFHMFQNILRQEIETVQR